MAWWSLNKLGFYYLVLPSASWVKKESRKCIPHFYHSWFLELLDMQEVSFRSVFAKQGIRLYGMMDDTPLVLSYKR